MSNKSIIGDLVKFKQPKDLDETKLSFKLQGEPFRCLQDFLNINNPKIINNQLISECSQIPEDPGYWVVVDLKTLFDKRGYAFKVLKISNIKTGSSGWVAEKSIVNLKDSNE